MIDVTQLMIGSWVRHAGGNNELWQLDISLLTDIVDGLIQVDGIPLTTDWLERAGFVEVPSEHPEHHPWSSYLLNDVSISLPYFEYAINEDGDTVELKMVHELQLLMAGLGRPLTFK